MIRIIDERASGKTTSLLYHAKSNDAYVCCKSPTEMRNRAYRIGITGIDYISYHDLLNKNYNPHKQVMIDELESFLHYACSANITGYTLSRD